MPKISSILPGLATSMLIAGCRLADSATAPVGTGTADHRLLVGWGQEEISIHEPVTMVGYGDFRMSYGVQDPLFATALALDDGEDAVIFVSLDLLNPNHGLTDAILAAMTELAPEIPKDKLLLNATHTHSSIGTYGDMTGIPEELGVVPPEEARRRIARQVVAAVRKAWQNRTPGGIAWGYGLAVSSSNRRMVYFDDLHQRSDDHWAKPEWRPFAGHAEIHGVTADDQFSHYETGTDNYINFLYTFDDADRLTGAIVNLACTAQLSSGPQRKLTSDLWHDVRAKIAEKHPGVFILPQCSGAGDLMPYGGHYLEAEKRRLKLKYGDRLADFARACDWPDTTDANREFLAYRKAMRLDIAERVAATFDETLAWAGNDIRHEAVIRNRLIPLELTPLAISDAELDQATAKLKKYEATPSKTDGPLQERAAANYRIANGKRAMQDFIERACDQRAGKKFPTEIRVVRIGDIAFAGNGFELFMDYMHRIQARSPFSQTFVVELSGVSGNFWGGYLPTARAVPNRGYSATVWQCPVGPEGGQELVEATLKNLKELHP